ncbi:salicylic acid-binding protein 2 isoform X2 [Helianthus annuus]|uniref:salicylic acid-binding protein 2 isoform X2 n=1 Tax=Helianthus annuus TaxID=4232 RepID=UPI001652D4F4|nr:salicylic acid-binding protein 2 isoform X2 [Helianthus annuus]
MGLIDNEQKHFVLVHGACHGAWCWFKLKPLLEAAGHRVSAFDLSASGTNTEVIQHVTTLSDYTKPLLEFMAAVPPEEKVVLVGHSLGGMNIALAMEKFPEKVSVAVFLAAFMPDYVHKLSYVLDQDLELGKMLIRPSSLFMKDLQNANQLTEDGYGYVRRVYIICDEDKAIKKGFQQWMIDNNPVDSVKELKDVDHMAMLCDPKQINVCLLDIAHKYA